MTEAVVVLSVVVAVQSLVVASLPFLLWRFVAQRAELAELRRDLDELDRVVEAAVGGAVQHDPSVRRLEP